MAGELCCVSAWVGIGRGASYTCSFVAFLTATVCHCHVRLNPGFDWLALNVVRTQQHKNQALKVSNGKVSIFG
jgi:hypothetical protein